MKNIKLFESFKNEINEAADSEIRFTSNDLAKLAQYFDYTKRGDVLVISPQDGGPILGTYNQKTSTLFVFKKVKDNPLNVWLKDNSFLK